MRIIRFKELEKQYRPDGRTVTKILQQKLNRDISSMQFLYVTHPANLRENLHVHENSYELLVFLDNARYRINGKNYEIDKNNAVLFEPGDIHGATPIDHEVRLFVFQNPAITEDKKTIGS